MIKFACAKCAKMGKSVQKLLVRSLVQIEKKISKFQNSLKSELLHRF